MPPIASTSSEISGVIPLAKGRKAEEGQEKKEREGEKESATFLRAAESGVTARNTKIAEDAGFTGNDATKETHNYHSYVQLWRAPNC